MISAAAWHARVEIALFAGERRTPYPVRGESEAVRFLLVEVAF